MIVSDTKIIASLETPPENPLVLLQQWLIEADCQGINAPRDIALSTIDLTGRPASRIVLLRGCDDRGIIFSTTEHSAKGKALEVNPYAAATLWWRETTQQINMHGKVIKCSSQQSDEIFYSRPRDAQAISAVSEQSMPLANEEMLRHQFNSLVQTDNKIERPYHWHAYHLVVESIEFWQGCLDRFDKRLKYDLVNDHWQHQILQP
ncbi:MAG: pyridoxamine 5'-phosphate oxidase [Gammaproteobacteria bacterium 39-13]|jgi:pyridoxamine 5'-phosphate oxidase|nr:pyridoxal 5'-phosphate synthase [Gammaproteobacteria bacterium]OJV96713.1 MAG: pyridoxamine 5'-phosphate oxidase [Gammaproteobacteria bacterium 39-13]